MEPVYAVVRNAMDPEKFHYVVEIEQVTKQEVLVARGPIKDCRARARELNARFFHPNLHP